MIHIHHAFRLHPDDLTPALEVALQNAMIGRSMKQEPNIAVAEPKRKPSANAKSITHNGKEYDSIRALAREYSVSERTLRGMIARDALHELEGHKPKRGGKKPIMHNGTEYPSMSALARALGISTTTISERVASGKIVVDFIGK